MLHLKFVASVVPFMALAAFVHGTPGSASHPCIAFGDTSVELASLPWSLSGAAQSQVAFTDDPARATVRVQVTDDADSADFVVVDDRPGSEADSCQASAASRLVAISAHPTGNSPVIYLSNEGPADYRIYVRSKTFSPRDAAALIVGAGEGAHHAQAASL